MAGSKKLRRWQSTADLKMKYVISRADFQKDIAMVRKETETKPTLNKHIRRILVRYDLPSVCFELVRDYILDGYYRDVSTLRSPLMLLSFEDNYVGPDYDDLPLDLYITEFPKKHVFIDVTGNIQKQDLLDFVNQNWRLIEEKLKLITPERAGAVKQKQMNVLHNRVLELRESGKTYKQISEELGLSIENVSKILQRMRKK